MSSDERELRFEKAVAKLAKLTENRPVRYASFDEPYDALMQMNGGQRPTLSLDEADALLTDLLRRNNINPEGEL